MTILLQIISKEDAKSRGMKRFYTGVPCIHGHNVERNMQEACVECERIRSREYGQANKEKRRLYARQNKDRDREWRREWEDKNRVTTNRQKRERYADNPEPQRSRRRKYYAENREDQLQKNKVWREMNRSYLEEYWVEHRGDYARRTRQRRAQIKLSTPSWLTEAQKLEMKYRVEEAKAISVDTGVLHQVDHIIPLQSDVVCGLHVPWNLRVITAQENHKKSNSVIQDLATA